jgi:hypothetical protein
VPLIHDYRNDAGDIVDIIDRVNRLDVEHSQNAEQGTIATCELPVDDPDAAFAISGHRIVTARETAIDAESDPWGGYAWIGYSAERGIQRGELRTGAERGYAIQLADLNTVLERRLLLGTDCNRPAETDVERMQWLAGTNELLLIDDTTYLSTEDPVNLEANDFRKQSPTSVIRGCMDQSGKNAFVTWVVNPDETPGAAGVLFSLWYGHDNLEVLTSDARICNIQSEVDGDYEGLTFYPFVDTILTRSPSRVYSGVVVDYDGGYVYVTRDETATEFALGGRDTTLSAPDVKSAAQARARGRRFLTDMATEEDSITTSIIVPAAQLNVVMPGHRIEVRFSHLPGYQDEYVWMRVANKKFRPLNHELYQIDLDLVAPAPTPPTLPLFGILRGSGGPYTTENGANLVHWANPGDTPGPGFPLEPTTGLLTVLTDGSPPHLNRTHYGYQIDGDGTIDVEFYTTIIGIASDFTVVWSILLNGLVVETESQVVAGASGGTVLAQLLTIDGLAVANGDVLTASIESIPPTVPFFRTPAGTGQNGERLAITGGSLS